jgi:hypothetical protein
MEMNHDSTATLAFRSGDKETPPSVSSAVERVLNASQRLITDRFDLVRLESAEALSRALCGGALLSVGGILICGGWFVAMAIIVVLLDQYAPRAVGLAVVAVLSGAAGGSIVALGLRRLLAPGSAQKMNEARHA